MKILLIYPEFPETFWSFKHALKFIMKKSTNPPLGLLTLAALLPEEWEQRLVDMNVRKLEDRELQWADYVFISGISIQKKTIQNLIDRCQRLNVKTVAGGPLFTSGRDDVQGVDHLVLNEAEITLPRFIRDLEAGCPQPVYTDETRADLNQTPVPRWDLIKMKNYAFMNIQYSRGCPFNCDFCDITLLYGQRTRIKSTGQVLAELDELYARHWRGNVFFVDDNFIGNKQSLKKEVLPAIAGWMKEKKYPFEFFTQTSINLADDEELMQLMAQAGFNTVFVGIESPNDESLAECTKFQNQNRNLIESVKTLQQHGFQVQGGFIVGFDSDPLSIFEQQIRFIQKTGIVTAMVGLLSALKGTKLYQRLQSENRLLQEGSGDNTDFSMNFIPKMKFETLQEGYRKIISQIYSPKHYYARVKTFLREYRPFTTVRKRVTWTDLAAFFRSVVSLGILGKERFHYWGLLFWSLFTRPRVFPLAVALSIYGFNYRQAFKKYLESPVGGGVAVSP